MIILRDEPFTDNKYDEEIKSFTKYELSDFQKWAIKAIIDGDHSLITAPTGSGKTLPAEFMIHYFNKNNLENNKRKRIIYASPIKALSNQKLHDMRKRFPTITFGLLTGDCKDNPDADVLIMTTEILRNTLFCKKMFATHDKEDIPPLSFDMDIDKELAGVIFDEAHYIADPDRGSVWEQSILMLPASVQLLLLSATINKPEAFGEWINNRYDNNVKNFYILPTKKRVVPLTHYMWLSANNGNIKKIYDKELNNKILNLRNKPILIKDANGKFHENNYHLVKKCATYLYDNYLVPKRQHIINDILSYLKREKLLPALCFVFSRKQVEIIASEVTVSLHDDNGLMANTVEQECRKILMTKLLNYKEYLDLPEYKKLICLLQKGIAIHHAGMLTILRELVEVLFDKGYIKILFATETFAVGINMPTKTVIFSSLSKFDGTGQRYLQAHEYAQMAGRAGRRGIDTTGTVIHCNSLFECPDSVDYCNILTGPSQSLTSKFKISYNFILNTLLPNNLDKKGIARFIGKSLLNVDIDKQIIEIDNISDNLVDSLEKTKCILSSLQTDITVFEQYNTLLEKQKYAVNKNKKKIKREIDNIISENPSLLKEYSNYENIKMIENSLDVNKKQRNITLQYIENCINDIIHFLETANFIKFDEVSKYYIVMAPGLVASQVQEINAVGLSAVLAKTNSFNDLMSGEIAGLLSCFVPVNIPEDSKTHRPNSESIALNSIAQEAEDIVDSLNKMEIQMEIDSGEEHGIHYDLLNPIIKWYISTNEDECRETIKYINNIGISTGDFVKAVLKICNATRELINAYEVLNDIKLLDKLSKIEPGLLKYIVTAQSLYI